MGDSLRLEVTVRIPDRWHINSHAPLDEFSIPTRLEISAPGLEFGRPEFPEGYVKHIEILGTDLSLFQGVFSVQVPVLRVDASVGANALKATQLILHYQACNEAICLPPRSIAGLYGPLPSGKGEGGLVPVNAPASVDKKKVSALNAESGSGPLAGFDFSGGIIPLFFLLLGAGLALNLTPCVYPMLAITISLFGTQSSSGLIHRMGMSVSYVMGIVITFSALGVFAAFSGNLFGSALQSPWSQVFIAATFVILALGSFGLYNIRLPQSLMGRAMQASNSQGYAGGLLAGLFAGVLAAPCIGPVVLALLIYVAEKGSVVTGLGMFATLALGMGIPYLILGTSSSLLTRLPKSGQWMVDVKNVLGVVLLVLAVYYARGFIGEKVYGLLFGGLILYIGLYINPFARLENVSRVVAGLIRLVAFLIVLYGTAELGRVLLGKDSFAQRPAFGPEASPLVWEEYAEPALVEAVSLNRPVVIDFQSKIWCAACREMEEKTFSRPEVRGALSRFRLLDVDVDKHPEAKQLQEQYGVLGIPTLIFLDAAGREVDRVVGFLGPQELLQRMQLLPITGENPKAEQEEKAIRANSIL